eukprot:SAG31_NODE_3905_length_3765_cov_6.684670_3_plen_196_part_00
MNQIIRGIDFEIMPGNPGAIALYFEGAQGGVINDVSVRLSPDSFAGFGGGGGAGTSHINIAVTGGVHGVYFCCSDGAPVVANARLYGQSGSAIVSFGGGPLIAVGVHIVRPPGAIHAAIQGYGNPSTGGEGGQLSVLDTVVECGQSNTTAVLSARASLYIRGLWTHGCSSIATHPGSRHRDVQAMSAVRGPAAWR